MRFLLVLAALGALLRVALWLASDGSNDVDGFRLLAKETFRIGQLDLYRHRYGVANHPPLVSYFAAGALWISDRTGVPFPIILKTPMMLADLLVGVLIWKIWNGSGTARSSRSFPQHRSRLLASVAATFYAWNLVAALISSFHCNTDPIYAALCLLAVYLIDRHDLNFLGGLVLGAALNVKLIPLILVVPLLLQYRSLKPILAFLAGLTIAFIPFLPFLYFIPHSFVRNLTAYRPMLSLWGFSFVLLEMIFNGIGEEYARTVIDRWSEQGRWALMAFMVLLGLIARRRNWNRYELSAACMAAFLVLAPGFAVQYTVLIVPMLCALSPMLGLTYGTVAGVFIGWVYFAGRVGDWPLKAEISGMFPLPAAIVGIVSWIILIAYLAQQLQLIRPIRLPRLFPQTIAPTERAEST